MDDYGQALSGALMLTIALAVIAAIGTLLLPQKARPEASNSDE